MSASSSARDYVWHGFHFTNMIPTVQLPCTALWCMYMAYRAWLMPQKVLHKADWFWRRAGSGDPGCSEALTSTVSWSWCGGLDMPIYLIYNLVFFAPVSVVLVYGAWRRPVPADATERQIARARRSRPPEKTGPGAGVTGDVHGDCGESGMPRPYFTAPMCQLHKGTTYTASVIRI